MNIAIVANGMLNKRLLLNIRSADLIIGVDRGAYWLLRNSVIPGVAIGDFDSTSPHELEVIKKKVKKVKEYPAQKDATDLELAVDYAISRKPQEVIMYGVIGSRFDHTLAGVNLLEKLLKKNIDAKVRDTNNEVILIRSRRTIKKSSTYTYLSLLSYTAKAIVTIKGVKYPVVRQAFRRSDSLGISNEITSKSASIEVHSGVAIIIRSRDESK